MCRVCNVYRVCYVWGLLCLAFVCLGFVMSRVSLSRVAYGTPLTLSYIQTYGKVSHRGAPKQLVAFLGSVFLCNSVYL